MARTIFQLVACLLLLQQSLVSVVQCETPDGDKTTHEMIEKHGYPAETHHVVTKDGYILALHRIPFSPNSPDVKEGRPAVLLQHGVLSSSFDWIVQGPGASLAYLLSDLGYDVWLGNARGNTYSRNHTTLNPNKLNFWLFSWQEKGVYDLPAMIDYILEKSGQQQLHYVGHSMGTTMALALLSDKPAYNAKVAGLTLLAPVATLSHSTSGYTKLVPYLDQLGFLATLFGRGEFVPRNRLTEFLGEVLCRDNAPIQEVCSNVVFLLMGWNSEEFNKDLLSTVLGHTPAGASTRDIIHYAQVIRDERFQKFDYGPVQNLLKYGRRKPPAFNLKKITVPVSLYHCTKDGLAAPGDVEWLSQQLPNVVDYHLVPLASFTHLDFIWAKHVDSLVNNRVASIMHQY